MCFNEYNISCNIEPITASIANASIKYYTHKSFQSFCFRIPHFTQK